MQSNIGKKQENLNEICLTRTPEQKVVGAERLSMEPIVAFRKAKTNLVRGWLLPTNALLPGGFLRLGWPFDTGTLSGNVSLGL